MIDLHSHILPGIDDGAPDDAEAIAMARLWVADGVTSVACTPHIYPGVYNNSGPDIRLRIERLQERLDGEGIPLRLVPGGDVHIAPDLVSKLRIGDALTLNNSRYALIETPHHILPPRVGDIFFNLSAAGYVPILTHPERMSWIEERYELIQSLAHAGVWMQLTAGSILGDFGSRPKYWSERMLDDGIVQIVASDAHGSQRRPPRMRRAFEAVVKSYGELAADQLFTIRPAGVLENFSQDVLFTSNQERRHVEAPSLWRRIGDMFWRQ